MKFYLETQIILISIKNQLRIYSADCKKKMIRQICINCYITHFLVIFMLLKVSSRIVRCTHNTTLAKIQLINSTKLWIVRINHQNIMIILCTALGTELACNVIDREFTIVHCDGKIRKKIFFSNLIDMNFTNQHNEISSSEKFCSRKQCMNLLLNITNIKYHNKIIMFNSSALSLIREVIKSRKIL